MAAKLIIDLAKCKERDNSKVRCSYKHHPENKGFDALLEKIYFALICRKCQTAPCVKACPQDALEKMNDSPFGLQAGIFTNNIDAMYQAYARLEVGAVLVNEIPTFRADHMPYGGIKDSGLGREGVRYVIQELTEPKLLIVKSPS
jgi:hypothetical protein